MEKEEIRDLVARTHRAFSGPENLVLRGKLVGFNLANAVGI